MQSSLFFIELKTGFTKNGPAYIGYAVRSKTGRTIFFNGRAFKRSTQTVRGNYVDAESGEEYWISGVKSLESDRLRGAHGPTFVEKKALGELLQLKGWVVLPSGFELFDPASCATVRVSHHERENRRSEYSSNPFDEFSIQLVLTKG